MDWEAIHDDPKQNAVEYLSLRGKNVFFLELVADALQLDKIGPNPDLTKFKKAFTAKAVQRIAEAVTFTWPNGRDLRRVLSAQKEFSSGLYSGTYTPEAIRRGVTRHSLYSDSLLLVDPLVDPRHVRDAYSPTENPDQHRSSTLRWITLWFSLAPWIETGIVQFIRSPGDFDVELDLRLMNQARQRFEDDPELASIQKQFVKEQSDELLESYKRQMQLSMPDEYLRNSLRRWKPSITDAEVEGVIRYMGKLREADPHFIHTADQFIDGELLQVTMGMNYDMTKLVAIMTGAHLVTDLDVRWKELESDKQRNGFDPRGWSPFSKAFQAVPWRFLDNVPLEAARTLREENRLEDMRSFLRKSWRAAAPEQAFDPAAATNLAAELNERMREAETEWSQINRDLAKWFGTELTVGILGLAPAISVGAVSWAAGGLVSAAVTNLAVTAMRRAEWERTFPAGFFVQLRKQTDSPADAT